MEMKTTKKIKRSRRTGEVERKEEKRIAKRQDEVKFSIPAIFLLPSPSHFNNR